MHSMIHSGRVSWRQTLQYLVASLLLVAALAVPAHARSDKKIYETLSVQEVSAILKEEGYSVFDVQSDSLRIKLNGYKVVIFVADDKKSIQAYLGMGNTDTTLEQINKWNRGKRFSRSYLDSDSDPVLELDLDLTGGVTRARIDDFFLTMRVSVDQWLKQVIAE